MKSFGYALWLILPIELLALTYLSPVMDSWAHWTLAVATVALTLWAAVRLTFNWQVQRFFGVVFTVFGVFVLRRFQATARRIRAKREPEIVIPERPKVATKSIDLVRTHPRILNRGLTVVLGYGANKRPISIDLTSQHTLIGASTGAGKTNLLNSFLIQLFSKRRNDVDVYLVDLKGNHEDALYKWGAIASYVDEVEPALDLLRYLERAMNARNKQAGRPKRTILLVIDEVADLTTGTEAREHRQSAVRLLTLLARKARSANIFLVIATQHPRYDVLDKAIANMLLRKICLAVDTAQQAEVILGFGLRSNLPKQPGEFVLKDGLGIKRGQTLLVGPDESEEVILRRISNFKDKRLQLWKDVAAAKRVGDGVTGINRMYEAKRPQYDLDFVRYGYRHLHYAGVLDPPVKGGRSRIRVAFLEGIPLIQQYIEAEKWTGAPKPVVIT